MSDTVAAIVAGDWVSSGDAPTPQSPGEVADALCELVLSDAPSLACHSGPASEALVAGAVRDPHS